MRPRRVESLAREPVGAVTFDATGTLIRAPRLGEVYAEVFGRHGLDAEAAAIEPVIREVWQELACLTDGSTDRFSSHPDGPRGWWQRFAERVAERLELPPPSRFATAELFDRFARSEAWQAYPDAAGALAALRRRGLGLAVVSNWDDRLAGVLEGLGLAAHLDAVVVSAEVGYEKPDPRIFLEAARRLGLDPERIAHVGDRRREDVEGALALGMRAILLDRRGPSRRQGGSGAGRASGSGQRRGAAEPAADAVIASLAELPDRLSG